MTGAGGWVCMRCGRVEPDCTCPPAHDGAHCLGPECGTIADGRIVPCECECDGCVRDRACRCPECAEPAPEPEPE